MMKFGYERFLYYNFWYSRYLLWSSNVLYQILQGIIELTLDHVFENGATAIILVE
jgi:hypothetical protein